MRVVDLKDRFVRSLVAGFIASIILFALNLFSYYVLNFSNRRYINYSALMIFGREFRTTAEAILSSIAQISFAKASRITRPKVSVVEGKTKMSLEA